MWDLYWITRLDAISGWLIAFTIFFGIFLGISIVFYFITKYDEEENLYNSAGKWNNFWSTRIKITIPCFILLLIGAMLVPNSREAYMIYGVGGTIDYVRNDSTLTNIPHKCIEALDLWVDKELLNKKSEQ